MGALEAALEALLLGGELAVGRQRDRRDARRDGEPRVERQRRREALHAAQLHAVDHEVHCAPGRAGGGGAGRRAAAAAAAAAAGGNFSPPYGDAGLSSAVPAAGPPHAGGRLGETRGIPPVGRARSEQKMRARRGLRTDRLEGLREHGGEGLCELVHVRGDLVIAVLDLVFAHFVGFVEYHIVRTHVLIVTPTGNFLSNLKIFYKKRR